MTPSKLSRRAAIMSGLLAGTFAVTLAATPAQAGQLGAGDACPSSLLTPASVLAALNLKCVGGTLVSTITAATSPLSSALADTVTPKPLASLTSGLTTTVSGLTDGSNPIAEVSPVASGAAGSPGAITTVVPQPRSATSTKTGSTTTTSAASASTTGASSLPSTAAGVSSGATLAGQGSSSADLTSLSDNATTPLTGSGTVQAGQAPLTAAGRPAASRADPDSLTGDGSDALSDVLIAIATVMIAAVGAANLRVWQSRPGNAELRAWKRSTR